MNRVLPFSLVAVLAFTSLSPLAALDLVRNGQAGKPWPTSGPASSRPNADKTAKARETAPTGCIGAIFIARLT